MENIQTLFDVNEAYQCLTTEMIESGSVSVVHLERMNSLIHIASKVPLNSACEATRHRMIGVIVFVRDNVEKALKS